MSEETTPSPSRLCPGCGKPAAEPPDPVVVQGTHPSGLTVDIHEVCALRAQLLGASRAKSDLTVILAAILRRLGGTVRLHQQDLEAAQAANDPVSRRTEGRFEILSVVEDRRIVVAAPGEPEAVQPGRSVIQLPRAR